MGTEEEEEEIVCLDESFFINDKGFECKNNEENVIFVILFQLPADQIHIRV
ncbi:hypothetical protein L484_013546 [Morus notabilis]|uniref:Uncharacterized protein n=1 Tax=Morus notabilis TaxID=981085 RepID=W9QP95_9ROSA|nr:hypothetical protein L484_013546 [Morus notabilis]